MTPLEPGPAAAPAGPVPPPRAALVVIGAGVCAALHIGKLPPAIPALQQALGLSLIEAGFVLSLVQLAGMTTGAVFGAVCDQLGGRRSQLTGLLALAIISLLGGTARDALSLMVLRALEGFSFLLVVLPAPGLIRQLVPPGQAARAMGLWGAYMPVATTTALLLGPVCIDALGWRGWWWLLAGVTALACWAVARGVPATAAAAGTTLAPPAAQAEQAAQAAPVPTAITRLWTPLRATLTHRAPWLLALAFGAYSLQWMAVIGFLPTIYHAAGLSGWVAGVLTAVASAGNIIGNVGAGRLQQRGVTPLRLLAVGFVTMAVSGLVAFAVPGVPAWLRYGGVLALSTVGGLVPATLFSVAARAAPGPQALSTTVGWMQQGSAFGQFVGPPFVAWLAARAGGWTGTGVATAFSALVGLGFALALMRHLEARRAA